MANFLKKLFRFFKHIFVKVPMWWEISGYKYQLETVFATDSLRQHEEMCALAKKQKNEVNKIIKGVKVKKSRRTKRV